MNEVKPLDLSFERILNIIKDPSIGDYRKAHEIEKCIKDAARRFIRELGNAFDSADIDDTIWYDSVTTLYDEIVLRFERIFGEIDLEEEQ